MGLFDLLRGLVPGAAQQLARNSGTAVANQPPSWLVDPAAYDWSDVLAPSPLPDRVGAPNLPEPVPLLDGLHPSFDDIHAQLLAGAASRIGPEHFALNPDNWLPPALNPAGTSLPGTGYDASPFVLPASYLDPLQFLSQQAGNPTSLQDRQDNVSDNLPPTAQQRPSTSGAPVVAASAAAPALPYLSGISVADLLPAGVALGLPLLAGLGAFFYPSSTASDDTRSNGRCPPAYNQEGTDDTSDGSAADGAAPGEQAPSGADEASPRPQPAGPRPKSSKLRKAYEEEHGVTWPTDPETGRNMEVAHKKARGDGGTDDVWNYEPLPHSEHVKRHREAGDFSRWSKRRGRGE